MVAVEWVITSADAGIRLDKFLAAEARLGSRSRAFGALQRGKVFVDEREVSGPEASSLLREGQRVRVWLDRPGSGKTRDPRPAGDLEIVFEDESMIVVNKPAGVLSVPLERKRDVPSVYDQIESHWRAFGKRRPFVVHRIDQDTSGLVVFAKTADAQAVLKGQFRRREPARTYLALVHGRLSPASGTWRDHLVWDDKALIQKATHPRDPRASEAISEFSVREAYRQASLVEVRLVTGRRNQIRLQARLRGHPLVGERRYTFDSAAERPIQFERHALHAWRLEFRHPADDRPLQFEAPLPKDFAALLARLRR